MSMEPTSKPGEIQPSEGSLQPTDSQIHAISNLIAWADEPEYPGQVDQEFDDSDNQLIQVSLGIASGLFYALQAKHFPTASHSLRVAKMCSRWATDLELEPFQRDQLEVAALLHDIGKMGVPDYVLTCPGKLPAEEQTLMDRSKEIGLEILSACCDGEEIIDLIRYNFAWYDGSRGNCDRKKDSLPIEARMLAIADAYDSMTVDQIFRRARSKDRAMAELVSFAGTQFDPELVGHFCELQSRTQSAENGATRHWLRVLSPDEANKHWRLNQAGVNLSRLRATSAYQESLVRHIHDAVIYLDLNLAIVGWNQAAERLTGINRETVEGHQWTSELLGLADQQGRSLSQKSDPVRQAIMGGAQSMTRLSIRNADNKFVTVAAHVVPVIGEDGKAIGATIQLHDTSGMESLEEQIESLHYRATRDPLTGLVNRAEMDRSLAEMVDRHATLNKACSVIICDIDFFKKINDTYGHPAGDEALIVFAKLLQTHARSADVTARYGGEEFVILCPNCDGQSASSLAEAIRAELAAIPLSALGGKSMTASFGVTELQRGDTADTILNRADRALLQSKEMGRNIVTQIGGGLSEPVIGDRRHWWHRMFMSIEPEVLLKRAMKTRVPLNLAVEKIRGFVADHRAAVSEVKEDSIKMVIDGESLPMQRRSSDRAVPLILDLQFSPITAENGSQHTKVQISISPRRNRDRRKRDAIERARHILQSLQSYLVAYEFVDTTVATIDEGTSWWSRIWGRSKSGESR